MHKFRNCCFPHFTDKKLQYFKILDCLLFQGYKFPFLFKCTLYIVTIRRTVCKKWPQMEELQVTGELYVFCRNSSLISKFLTYHFPLKCSSIHFSKYMTGSSLKEFISLCWSLILKLPSCTMCYILYIL